MIQECCTAWIRIPKDHPALPGHFPGAPVVPGVVLLDELLSAAQRELGRALGLSGLPQVKFLSPLFPDEPAVCRVEIEGARLAFRVERDGQVIARGALSLAGSSARLEPA